VQAQRGNIWCFGDSTALDFNNLSSPIATSSSIVSRGSCVSIADTSGDLLFYAHTRSGAGGSTNGLIYNENHQLMFEGDSIAGAGWYQEMIIVPNPADDSSFYVFSVGVTNQFGLMYTIVDMRGDGGLGAVTQKNVQLLNFLMVDCILAVKHGNGRDWWVIVRKSPVPIPTNDNNSWYSFLISPSGISAMPIQNVGTLNGTNTGRLNINSAGNKIVFVNAISLIELYNFDRCTGLINNPVQIEPSLSFPPYPTYWSSEFSNSDQLLYVTSSTNPISRLWQYDTWAPNILASKTLIWQTSLPPNTAGAVKRGPDEKIYLSCGWIQSNGWYYYPYDSSMYYPENMNLSVINSPDSAGLACDFQPWSFYLGGKRTYWGLPNNPDYDLGPLVGSTCDTIVSVNEPTNIITNASMHVYYASDWEKAFINADKLKGTNCKLQVIDAMGRLVFKEQSKISPPYYTKSLNCTGWAKGMYVVSLATEKEKLTKKFVIE